jgi:hypothetical protein
MSWVKRHRNLTTGAVFWVAGTVRLEGREVVTDEGGTDMLSGFKPKADEW